MDKVKKKKNEKIEIGIADIVEEVEEVETLEIKGDSLLIRIPNNLETITRVKRILEVYEEELKRNVLKAPEMVEESIPTLPKLPTLPELPKLTPEINIQAPEPPAVLPVLEEQKKVEVRPFGESYTVCPLCSGKLKRKKLKQVGESLNQRVVCKNRRCNFEREYIFSI